MRLTLNQPYFLPYLEYFQLINTGDIFVIADDFNYPKGDWINRNRLLLDGKRFVFTLNVEGASQNKLINEVYVSKNQPKLLKTIEVAYKKAPFFSIVFPMIEKMVRYEDRNLARFNANSLMLIADYLHIATKFIYSSEITEKNPKLRAQERILNICSVLKATEYVNLHIIGKQIYDVEVFNQHGINFYYIDQRPIEYQQFNKYPFAPNLSILDVMMFNPVEEIAKMLLEFDLGQPHE